MDSLNWAAELRREAYGVALGIRTSRPRHLAVIVESFPLLQESVSTRKACTWFSLHSREESSGPTLHLALQDSTELACSEDLDYILDVLEYWMVSHVADASPSRVFMHSGAIGWQGQAILLPGESRSGKSSLVSELVRAGAEYYSDEFALLDPQGRLHGYPKPLSLRKGGSNRQTDHPVESFGGRVGRDPLPVGLVLFTSYREGARFRPLPLTRGEGTLQLLPHTAGTRRDAPRVLDTLQNLGQSVRFLKGDRGEAVDVAPLVLEEVLGSGL